MGRVERWEARILDELDVCVTKIRHKALDEEEKDSEPLARVFAEWGGAQW